MEAMRDIEGIAGRKQIVTVFGVEYLHITVPSGDDLYLTQYGLPFAGNLLPDNLYADRQWFKSNAVPLSSLGPKSAATSAAFKVRTKPWRGRSLDVVLKWNRMGQDIPGAPDIQALWDAEFNTPYEEFALLLEMRNTARESPGRLRTHKPLGIYVPHVQENLHRLGRLRYKMQRKMRNHDGFELDMSRSYAVLYEWIGGVDAVHAAHEGLLTHEQMAALTLRAEAEMRQKGFCVADNKPHHIIVRPRKDARAVLRDRGGEIAYALIDFELLQRTPEREAAVKSARRYAYLQEQAHRFDRDISVPMPPHLKSVSIMGVDYIYGPAESTGGSLWVVGRDPRLFDYFLPERWRHMPAEKLSPSVPVYHTRTKDSIELVWKTSHVGELPDVDPAIPGAARIRAHGYNSPFEEVALCLTLGRAGLPTTYPRAIYMGGHSIKVAGDGRRVASHREWLTPEGTPVLRADRDYITVWGYWNKPDDMLARDDRDYYQSINALCALREGILNESTYDAVLADVRARMHACGVEDLAHGGDHILISLDARGSIIRTPDGLPEARICNFELLSRCSGRAV